MKEKKSKSTKKVKKEKKSTKPAVAKATEVTKTTSERTFQQIMLTDIRVNPLNPRKIFSGPKYDELLASIRTKGVIVPILVRPLQKDIGNYEIIAGERRFRVAQEIARENGGPSMSTIPAIVQEMSDDDAFDCMTIENLQRADLTELEEARAFQLYLEKKGPESLPDLAERIGINPCYIRRRTAVLTLPEDMLTAWENKELLYGHLEQLIRISDLNEQKEFFEAVIRQDMSIKRLKERIESQTPKLANALFNRKEHGCVSCTFNTNVQRSLFGEAIASKSLCLAPKCFKSKQERWIQENWEKFKSSRNLTTNGARFQDDVRWDERHSIYTAKEKCKACEHLQSIITLAGGCDDKISCLGPKKCHDALYNPSSAAAKKKADPNAPRVSWHGEYFREEFFKTRIPELMTSLPQDDEKVLRILLLTLLETHDDAASVFGKKYDAKYKPQHERESYSGRKSWPIIEQMQGADIKSILQDLSLLILMDTRTTPPPIRYQVAVHLGSDLTAEWRMTKEYLDKKTTKEIHAIAEQFGLFKEDKAQTYLYETLGKKRGRFDLCKKGELVKVVLESGIDLAGKVPAEIQKQPN